MASKHTSSFKYIPQSNALHQLCLVKMRQREYNYTYLETPDFIQLLLFYDVVCCPGSLSVTSLITTRCQTQACNVACRLRLFEHHCGVLYCEEAQIQTIVSYCKNPMLQTVVMVLLVEFNDGQSFLHVRTDLTLLHLSYG